MRAFADSSLDNLAVHLWFSGTIQSMAPPCPACVKEETGMDVKVADAGQRCLCRDWLSGW